MSSLFVVFMSVQDCLVDEADAMNLKEDERYVGPCDRLPRRRIAHVDLDSAPLRLLSERQQHHQRNDSHQFSPGFLMIHRGRSSGRDSIRP